MNGDLVSVIVPTFGRPWSLKGAVDSALNQTHTNIEVVIVDDNSPGSVERLETERLVAQIKDSRVLYIKQLANGGGARARNAGVEVSSGQYICFLDDDDLFHPRKVADQVDHIKSNNLDVSLCSMNMAIPGGRGVTVYPVAGSLREFVVNGNVMNGMLMLKKEFFLRAGGFSEVPRFQDHILMFNIYKLNPKVGMLPKELYFYKVHFENRISSSKKSRIAYEVRHEYENSYRSILSVEESASLELRQKRSLFRCDLDGSSGREKLALINHFLYSGLKSSKFGSNLVFVIRYALSKSILAQRLRYFLGGLTKPR